MDGSYAGGSGEWNQRYVTEPIFEKEFAEASYGFRPHRNCKDALREVEGLLKHGYTHVLDADLRQCFDRIPHAPLMNCIKERIADTRLLDLIEMFLKQGVMEQVGSGFQKKELRKAAH